LSDQKRKRKMQWLNEEIGAWRGQLFLAGGNDLCCGHVVEFRQQERGGFDLEICGKFRYKRK
jgi:hypothetical protein